MQMGTEGLQGLRPGAAGWSSGVRLSAAVRGMQQHLRCGRASYDGLKLLARVGRAAHQLSQPGA